MRPFLTNERVISGNKISLFEGENLVNNDINVAWKSPGIRSTSALSQENTNLTKATEINVEKYSSHPNIVHTQML